MKIIFLEDRPDRQKQFLPNKSEDVEKLKNIDGLFLPDVNECKKIVEQINNQNYIIASETRLIFVHRSIIKNMGISYLNNQCKSKKIKLVYYSGGIRQSIFNNDGFEQLNLNSSDLYSDLLIPFCEKFIKESNTSLLEVFHKDWKLTYLMLYRQLVKNADLTKEEGNNPDSYEFQLKQRIQRIELVIGTKDIEDIERQINKLILNS